MKITSTKNAGINRLKGLIVGRSSAGKTFLASTIKEPTLVISAESGHLTLNKFDIPMIDITVDEEGNLLSSKGRYEKLLSVFSYLKTDEVRKKYKWIYIDGITEIGGIIIRMLEEDAHWGRAKMAIPRYGEYTKIMTKIILLFRDIPYYNVFFTALVEEKIEKDPKSGDVIKKHPASVLMPGSKIPENIPAYFDEVLYLSSREEKDGTLKRYILTEATGEAFAKDRSTRLNKYEPVDLGEIAKKIRGLSEKK